MSTATDLPQGQTKTPYQDSTVVTAKYELDGVAEDGSSDASQNQFGSGYTRNDQKDMHRMGKNQELMVRASFDTILQIACSPSVANVSFLLDLQLYHHDTVYVGVFVAVSAGKSARETTNSVTNVPVAQIIKVYWMVAWLAFSGHTSGLMPVLPPSFCPWQKWPRCE